MSILKRRAIPLLLAGMTITASAAMMWTSGLFRDQPNPVVPFSQQQAVQATRTGRPIVKSNNPEKITSTGWLVQHAFTDPQRGGALTWLSGDFRLYLSHLNGTPSPLYVQVIAVNPHAQPLLLTYQGSVLTSAEAGDRNGVVGRSNYYQVSENLLKPLSPTAKTIPPRGAIQLAVKRVQPKGSVDGLLVVNAALPGVFTYVVATTTTSLNEALRLAHPPATRKPAQGNIKPPTPTTFGTEAGVYATSQVRIQSTLVLPPQPGFLALSINYADYELQPANAFVQTAPPLLNGLGQPLRLSDSAFRTQGNYGHEYFINLSVSNPHARPQQATIWFASNAIGASRQLLYNGAIAVNGQIQRVLTTPQNPRQVLTTLQVPPQAAQSVQLRFFVPGLSSAGKQLIIEAKAN